jgi:hypothetical protein
MDSERAFARRVRSNIVSRAGSLFLLFDFSGFCSQFDPVANLWPTVRIDQYLRSRGGLEGREGRIRGFLTPPQSANATFSLESSGWRTNGHFDYITDLHFKSVCSQAFISAAKSGNREPKLRSKTSFSIITPNLKR